MQADLKIRKQVTLEQLQGLIEFLKDHQELARGLTRGRRGKLHTLKQWNLCAKRLNVYPDGATKDGKAWSKYWCDWKYRVRRRAMELKAARDNNRPPPEGVTPLSAMEENILKIIGEGALDNIIIKMDPLGEDTNEEQQERSEETMKASYATESEPIQPAGKRKRRRSSADLSEVDDSDGHSSPVVHRLKTTDNQKTDDDAAMFLRLEREKIVNDRKMYSTVRALTTQVTKLTEVMSHIRDVLVNRV